LCKGVLSVVTEPLFSRYLFIRLDASQSAKSWSPIRSTKGVSHMVTFGTEPAKVGDELVNALRQQVETLIDRPRRLFTPGQRVLVTQGAFAGIEAIYDMNDGESRAMVFVELLSKATRMGISPADIRKII
jgi:transcriptional antiterminator RfaH